jgi:hypothetical protein
LCSAAGIEDLREKREQILKQIQDEESEKAKIQTELAALTQRLSRINGQCKIACLASPGHQAMQLCHVHAMAQAPACIYLCGYSGSKVAQDA